MFTFLILSYENTNRINRWKISKRKNKLFLWLGKTIHLNKKCQKKMFHLLFVNYVTKLFELMVLVYLKLHGMQVDSYIYNVKKLVKSKVWFHWIIQMFPQSPSLMLFFHQNNQLSEMTYYNHLRQLTPIFHLLQLMAMENYSEKCSQIQILLKDINKARRKLNILFNSS